MNITTDIFIELNKELRGWEGRFVDFLLGVRDIHKELNQTPFRGELVTSMGYDEEGVYEVKYEIVETPNLYCTSMGDYIRDLNDAEYLAMYKDKLRNSIREDMKIAKTKFLKKDSEIRMKSLQKQLERIEQMTKIHAHEAYSTIKITVVGEYVECYTLSIKNAIECLKKEFKDIELVKVYIDRVVTERKSIKL